jgi:hypothetical protein
VLSGARFVSGRERLATGRSPRVRDRARHRVDRLLLAIGARSVAGQVLGPSNTAAAPAPPASRPLPAGFDPLTIAHLSQLVYELLDAHDDTARIAREYDREVFWEAHLDYLRALQRKGREMLARLDCPATGTER